jgi:hypothetical protein
MRVEQLGSAQPIHFVGESHCIAFGGMLFRAPWSGELFLCKSSFVAGIRGSEYFSPESGFHPDLLKAFTAERLIDAQCRPQHLAIDADAVKFSYFGGRPLLAPPMVLFAGEVDLLLGGMRRIGLTHDFELPDDSVFGVDRNKQVMPLAAVRLGLQRLLGPVVDCMERLQAVGFSRLMLHGLPPRPLRDAAGNARVEVPTFSKITVLANRLLADACRRREIPFIDIWPETAQPDGFLKPELALDNVHLTKAGALLSLDKIAAELLDHTAGTANPARYGLLAERAVKFDSAGAEAAEWTARGYAATQIDSGAAGRLRRNLAFTDAAANPQARTDWVGWPRHGRPGIALANPEQVDLQLAAELLSRDPARAILHAGAVEEFTVVSFRPLRVPMLSDSAIPASTLPSPPRTRRAVLHLAGEGSFEIRHGEESTQRIEARPGTLVVYDPERVQCWFRPRGAALEVVEMMLIPRMAGHPFRVVWAGLNDWPADPFQYSVSGMSAFPRFAGNSVTERSSAMA